MLVVARPKNANAEETRERILGAALELVAEHPAVLSAREVARRAGVSAGVVSHYFGGQDALVDACIETMYEKLDALATSLRGELVGGRSSPRQVIERAVREGYQLGCAHSTLVRVLLARVAASGALDTHRHTETESPTLAIVSALLAKRLGLPEAEVRLRCKTMIIAMARWSVSSDRELERLIGAPRDRGRSMVEQHLVGVAELLFPV